MRVCRGTRSWSSVLGLTPGLFSWLTYLVPGILVFSFPYLGLISNLLKCVTYIQGDTCVLSQTHSEPSVLSTYFRVRTIAAVTAASVAITARARRRVSEARCYCVGAPAGPGGVAHVRTGFRTWQ